jgi:L-ascorbate oxidase
MAGALIVRGDLDAIPGVAGLTERIIVAQYIEYYAPSRPDEPATIDPAKFYTFAPPANAQMSVNGLINPKVGIRSGEIQRWRLINATSEQYFYLQVSGPPNTPAGQLPQIYAIAVDGVPITNAPEQGGISVPFLLTAPATSISSGATAAEVVMNEIAVLAPAQRLDLLVQVPAGTAEGLYSVQAVSYLYGSPSSNVQNLVTIAVQGTKSPADALPASSAFNPGALFRPPLLPANQWPSQPTQRIQFGFMNSGGNPGAILYGTPPTNPLTPFTAQPSPFALPQPQAASNPAQLNLKRYSVQTPNQGIDLWEVSSDPVYGFGPHAFHIHINSFMLTQRFGVDISAAAIWRDTVRVDQGPATAPALAVSFVSQQVDYTGDFVLHCHTLQHEDFGMMWSVNISA